MFGTSSLRLNALFSGSLKNTRLISLLLITQAMSTGCAATTASAADIAKTISTEASKVASDISEGRRLREIEAIVDAMDQGQSKGMEAKITRHLKSVLVKSNRTLALENFHS